MSEFDLISGLISRSLAFLLKEIEPAAVAEGGPWLSLLSAALSSGYVKDLEAKLAGKVEALTQDELQRLEEECKTWAAGFLKTHPEAKKFWDAVKPPPATKFNLAADELDAILLAQKAGTLRGLLGLK